MWLAWCPGRKACPFLMPLLRNVLFEKEIRRTICWLYWQDLHRRRRRFLFWQHWSWGCDIISLEADIQIIPFSFWDYGYFMSGWQCPASPAVTPSGWRSKPIVTQLTSYASSFQAQWTIFWLATTSHKPISLTTRLTVKPKPVTCCLVMKRNMMMISKIVVFYGAFFMACFTHAPCSMYVIFPFLRCFLGEQITPAG